MYAYHPVNSRCNTVSTIIPSFIQKLFCRPSVRDVREIFKCGEHHRSTESTPFPEFVPGSIESETFPRRIGTSISISRLRHPSGISVDKWPGSEFDGMSVPLDGVRLRQAIVCFGVPTLGCKIGSQTKTRLSIQLHCLIHYDSRSLAMAR